MERQTFVPASELVVGKTLLLAQGGGVAHVTDIQIERGPPGTFTTYNLEVEGLHTYFVGEEGVWVHNAAASKCQRAFALWIRLKGRLGLADQAAFDELFARLPSATDDLKGSVLDSVVKSRRPELDQPSSIWTATNKRTASQSIWKHWIKHKGEFAGRIDHPIEYVERAIDLSSSQVSNPDLIVGWKLAFDDTWDKVVVDLTTRDFVSKSVSGPQAGKLRTLFATDGDPEAYIRGLRGFTETKPPGVVD